MLCSLSWCGYYMISNSSFIYSRYVLQMIWRSVKLHQAVEDEKPWKMPLYGALYPYIYIIQKAVSWGLQATPPPLKQASYWYGGHMGYLNNYTDLKGDIGVQDKRQISNECQWNGIWHPDIITGWQNGNRAEHTETCLATGGNRWKQAATVHATNRKTLRNRWQQCVSDVTPKPFRNRFCFLLLLQTAQRVRNRIPQPCQAALTNQLTSIVI